MYLLQVTMINMRNMTDKYKNIRYFKMKVTGSKRNIHFS